MRGGRGHGTRPPGKPSVTGGPVGVCPTPALVHSHRTPAAVGPRVQPRSAAGPLVDTMTWPPPSPSPDRWDIDSSEVPSRHARVAGRVLTPVLGRRDEAGSSARVARAGRTPGSGTSVGANDCGAGDGGRSATGPWHGRRSGTAAAPPNPCARRSPGGEGELDSADVSSYSHGTRASRSSDRFPRAAERPCLRTLVPAGAGGRRAGRRGRGSRSGGRPAPRHLPYLHPTPPPDSSTRLLRSALPPDPPCPERGLDQLPATTGGLRTDHRVRAEPAEHPYRQTARQLRAAGRVISGVPR